MKGDEYFITDSRGNLIAYALYDEKKAAAPDAEALQAYEAYKLSRWGQPVLNISTEEPTPVTEKTDAQTVSYDKLEIYNQRDEKVPVSDLVNEQAALKISPVGADTSAIKDEPFFENVTYHLLKNVSKEGELFNVTGYFRDSRNGFTNIFVLKGEDNTLSLKQDKKLLEALKLEALKREANIKRLEDSWWKSLDIFTSETVINNAKSQTKTADVSQNVQFFVSEEKSSIVLASSWTEEPSVTAAQIQEQEALLKKQLIQQAYSGWGFTTENKTPAPKKASEQIEKEIAARKEAMDSWGKAEFVSSEKIEVSVSKPSIEQPDEEKTQKKQVEKSESPPPVAVVDNSKLPKRSSLQGAWFVAEGEISNVFGSPKKDAPDLNMEADGKWGKTGSDEEGNKRDYYRFEEEQEIEGKKYRYADASGRGIEIVKMLRFNGQSSELEPETLSDGNTIYKLNEPIKYAGKVCNHVDKDGRVLDDKMQLVGKKWWPGFREFGDFGRVTTQSMLLGLTTIAAGKEGEEGKRSGILKSGLAQTAAIGTAAYALTAWGGAAMVGNALLALGGAAAGAPILIPVGIMIGYSLWNNRKEFGFSGEPFKKGNIDAQTITKAAVMSVAGATAAAAVFSGLAPLAASALLVGAIVGNEMPWSSKPVTKAGENLGSLQPARSASAVASKSAGSPTIT